MLAGPNLDPRFRGDDYGLDPRLRGDDYGLDPRVRGDDYGLDPRLRGDDYGLDPRLRGDDGDFTSRSCFLLPRSSSPLNPLVAEPCSSPLAPPAY